MEPTPQAIATTTFRVVKKGYDPDEVRAYLAEVARAVEASQAHAQSMETRARQAIAKANELAGAGAGQSAGTPAGGAQRSDEVDAISRTLLLAQRTADQTIAAARDDAHRIESAARAESDRLLADASAQAAKAVNDARNDARRVGEAEKSKVNEEVQQLLARLDFLKDDVAQMEAHVLANRERVAEVANELTQLAGRPLGGLGAIRRPTLSASADELRHQLAAPAPAPVEPVASMPAPTPAPTGGSEVAAAAQSVAPSTSQEPTMAIPAIRRVSESVEGSPLLDAPKAFADDFFDDIADAPSAAQLPLEDGETTADRHEVTAEVPVVTPSQAAPRLSMKFIDDDSL